MEVLVSDDPVLAALARLEHGQRSLDDRLQTLEQWQRTLEQGQKSLEQGQRELSARIDRTRSELMDRMDRLQDTVTTIRDDIAVNFGTAEQVRRANDNTRDELRALSEVVSGMQREICI